MPGNKAYFVTGTDTGVGKTFVTCTLLHVARSHNLKCVGMKPVAAGAGANGQNEDVEMLAAAASFLAPRELVNPYCFEAPVAPHIAAAVEGREIDPGRIAAAARDLAADTDLLLVEGVGGFRVPLGDNIDTADLAVHLGLPVILVVGLRLGCLNHALITADAIRARGLPLAGWVANGIDPDMPWPEENVTALKDRLAAPLLGVLPWMDDADPALAASRLSLP
ncbi:MAG: dethiobiotin synthase [Gammaproteobacteria bacterium]|nr:dethiobiotin synthase [Gammaproteobacteria bacterium]MBU1415302.1 dethiobiotin synthase [Gammaproteobacteria bacterium]